MNLVLVNKIIRFVCFWSSLHSSHCETQSLAQQQIKDKKPSCSFSFPVEVYLFTCLSVDFTTMHHNEEIHRHPLDKWNVTKSSERRNTFLPVCSKPAPLSLTPKCCWMSSNTPTRKRENILSALAPEKHSTQTFHDASAKLQILVLTHNF